MQELHQIAQFVSNLRYGDLPQSVIDQAKWIIRDTIGVIIAGMAEPEVAALADYAVINHPGSASLFGHKGNSTPAWSALVHGTAGTTLEMDEGHAFARGHAAVHALPPAIALAQAQGASGKDVLTGFIVGYEVAARSGIASLLRKSVHPFGAWGVIGAAAVVAWFQQLNTRDIAGVLELAASYAITPSFKTAYQGANVRNTFAGIVNSMGMLAAEFYPLGFRGENGGLQTTFGEILGHSFNPKALIDGLGERYEILRGYFKPYSACRYTHAAIDAVLGLRAEGRLDLNNVAAIEVATYDIAARLAEPNPKTPLAGRFSLPYVTAATLVTGGAGPEIFTSQMLQDPEILDIASKITVLEDPAFTALTPKKRPARVTLQYLDGSNLMKTVLGSKGDPDQPMTEDELNEKFHNLSDPCLGLHKASQVWDLIGQLEKLPDLSSLISLLAPQERSESEQRRRL